MNQEHLKRARRGEEWALQALYDEARGRVFRLALAVLGDAGSAEEAMQDSLEYALTHLDRFDPDRSAWTTWLHTITISRCRDRLRRRRLLALPLLGGLLARDPPPERLAEQRELTGSLHAALLRLSPAVREAVALRFLDECSFIEIGRILGCGEKTAQSRVRIGLNKLRALLEGDPA
ncbi:MAG TPA: RNA polymerase sigma factor, partial [Herpetosiphonaceae bacterium]